MPSDVDVDSRMCMYLVHQPFSLLQRWIMLYLTYTCFARAVGIVGIEDYV